jgi:YbbR domain-containing protein
MHTLKHWIVDNWLLKIASLFLATLLWAAVANQSSSEIGFEVPLEYRNIPGQTEITGDVTNTVQVRLRGSSNVINGISARDVATTVDLGGMRTGEKIVALSPHNVQAPFGAEVIRVTPSSVRFTLERTLTKTVPIVLTLVGQPENDYAVGKTLVSPTAVEAEGPEGRMNTLTSIETVPVRLDRRRSSFEQMVDLDVPDPQIRLKRPSAVAVKVEIHREQ